MSIPLERRNEIKTQHRRHETDSGSPEVQVAMITERVNVLSDHLKGHVKDFHSRRGLVLMVNRRNRLLSYLARTEPDRYQSLIGKLGLRK
ncbi:MAG: 30S ribosomal protein S15 [Phycisphaerales bacterium]